MKKVMIVLMNLLLLFSCMVPIMVFAKSQTQSTTLHYTVSATVIYEQYDGTRTIQKVEAGSYLKEPSHKEKKNSTFLGWKNKETGEFWDFGAVVEKDITLIACYQDLDKNIEKAEVILGNGLLYNGSQQIQTIYKIMLDGEEIPAEAYVIENNTGTEPGVYTMTIRAKEGSGYTGELTWIWLIAPSQENQLQETDSGDVQIGKGIFSIEIKVESNVSDISIQTSKADLLKMLIQNGDITADELSQLAKGAAIDIVIIVKNGASTITDASKGEMEKEAKGYKIGYYIDISLFKYITADGEKEEQQIHKTADLLTVSLKIPDSMINTNENIERTYIVLRNHEDSVDILNCTYDAENHTITFSTNQFSDYAIAYKDAEKNNQNRDNSSEINQKGGNQKESGQNSTPKTGDNTNFGIFIVLLIISVSIICAITYRKKSVN